MFSKRVFFCKTRFFDTLFCYEKSQDASFQRSLSVLCSTAATSPTSSLKKLPCCLSWLSKNHVLRLLPCFYTQKHTSFNRKKHGNMLFFVNVYVVYICIFIYVVYMYVYVLLRTRYALNHVSPTWNSKLVAFFLIMCFMFSATSLAQNMSRNSMKRWRKKMK